MASIFEGQPLQNKAFSNQNKGHLSSRYMYEIHVPCRERSDHIGPTEREVRKIIDSRVPFLGGDVLVSGRVYTCIFIIFRGKRGKMQKKGGVNFLRTCCGLY